MTVLICYSIKERGLELDMPSGHYQGRRTAVALRGIAAPSSPGTERGDSGALLIVTCSRLARVKQETRGMAPSYRNTAPQTTSTVVAAFQMSMTRTDEIYDREELLEQRWPRQACPWVRHMGEWDKVCFRYRDPGMATNPSTKAILRIAYCRKSMQQREYRRTTASEIAIQGHLLPKMCCVVPLPFDTFTVSILIKWLPSE